MDQSRDTKSTLLAHTEACLTSEDGKGMYWAYLHAQIAGQQRKHKALSLSTQAGFAQHTCTDASSHGFSLAGSIVVFQPFHKAFKRGVAPHPLGEPLQTNDQLPMDCAL